MRKDEAGRTDWVKHTRNAKEGKAGINRRVRHNVKAHLYKTAPEPEATNRPLP